MKIVKHRTKTGLRAIHLGRKQLVSARDLVALAHREKISDETIKNHPVIWLQLETAEPICYYVRYLQRRASSGAVFSAERGVHTPEVALVS